MPRSEQNNLFLIDIHYNSIIWNRFRLRGNEYFKAKEYENAVREYTRAITFDPAQAARSYNNRAISCE